MPTSAAGLRAHPNAHLHTPPTPHDAAAPSRRRGRPPKLAADPDEGNRRRHLIEGAARLFRTKGFDATSTRDIAAAAGMRSGSPFYHFKSKQALLHVVMHEGMLQAMRQQQAALAQLPEGAAPREQLRTLVRNHFEVLLGADSDFIPVMLYEWRSLGAAQRRDITTLKDTYEALWTPVLEALQAQGALRADPRVARLLIFGALHWAVQWFTPRGALSLDALTDEALALFLGDR